MTRDLDGGRTTPQTVHVSDGLPVFSRPPVIEVVCGLQFEELEMQTVHFGDFWQRVRDLYPIAEDHGPIATTIIDGDRVRVEQQQFFEIPPHRRVLLVDTAKNFLLQLGPSRFNANWRRPTDDAAYPRFEAAYARLVDGWERFNAYVLENDLGPISVNQYELTYINRLPEEGVSDLVSFFRWPSLDPTIVEPVSVGSHFRFYGRLAGGRGLLAVVLRHVERATKERMFMLEITARGRASSDGKDRDAWFSEAHEAIVQTFVAVTTAQAHDTWGRMR